MIWLRSTVFFVLGFLLTVVFASLAWLLWPLPPLSRNRIVSHYALNCMRLLRIICRLDYTVEGLENIPAGPALILCKHQSAWETLALQKFFPPQCWVAKRELMWVPFFGWGLAALSPIAIDRSKKKKAMQQVIEGGRVRIEQGFWIVIFPEGTRIAAGKRGQYKQGGARLALDLNIPIVPVAHNAGEFWPRNSLLKYPGQVSVVIGEPILPQGHDANSLTQAVEAWIEGQMQRIEGAGPCHPNNRGNS